MKISNVIVGEHEDVMDAIIKRSEELDSAWIFVSRKCINQLEKDDFYIVKKAEECEKTDECVGNAVIIKKTVGDFLNVIYFLFKGKTMFKEKEEVPNKIIFFIKEEEDEDLA